MSGHSLLTIAIILSFIAALIGLLIDKFSALSEYKATLLTLAAILALFSSLATLIGTEKVESENKSELLAQHESNLRTIKKIHSDNLKRQAAIFQENDKKVSEIHLKKEYKIDKLHENYTNDMKEVFGIISQRTVEQFLAEKTPSNLSEDFVLSIVEKALSKWIEDFLIIPGLENGETNLSLSYDPELLFNENDSSNVGCWKLGYTKIKRNVSIKTTAYHTYWDAYHKTDDGPSDHKYFHVIVDDGRGCDNSYITNQLSNKSRELIYKYCKWFEAINTFRTTHHTHSHVLIIVTNKRDRSMDEMLNEEMRLWIGYTGKPSLNRFEIPMVLYELDDLSNIKNLYN